jgi:ABC-type glutathione transport system ATPase component
LLRALLNDTFAVPSAANSNLGRNKPLMVCTRLWKLLDVLPMFRAHPPLASAFGFRFRARPSTHASGNADMDEVIRAKRQNNAGSLRSITIRGAREHNLKNVDLEIPRDRLVVFTGLSGSGKSSLAFDTIYAEGQR